jgi:hypothetical protein
VRKVDCSQLDVEFLLGQDVGTACEAEAGQFLQVHPASLVCFQRASQEIFGDGTEGLFGEEVVDLFVFDLADEFLLVFGAPGGFSGEHFEEDDSECPDIRFEGVLVASERLRGHVEGRADVVLVGFEGLRGLDGEPEICDLELLCVGDEDVGRLEVAVDDISARKVEVALEDLLHEDGCLCFRESLLDDLVEVGVAEFGDDVGVVLGGVDFAQRQDEGQVLEFLQHLDLALQQYFIYLILQQSQVDDFDGHR